MKDYDAELSKAVAHYWRTRAVQKKNQGKGGHKDAGERRGVTGGKHADGFVSVIATICREAGLPSAEIYTTTKKSRTLPGFFRPTKEWDIVVKANKDLVAVVEVKSQVGSFGNNFNNRIEEALGNATDFWTAYKEGVFQPAARPWLGYLFMLEEHPTSVRPMAPIELPHFPVLDAFQGLSYAERYQIACVRLVREGLYDAACFFTSNKVDGVKGIFDQPNKELSIRNFAISLYARAAAFAANQLPSGK